jgi:hypothetical protein
MTYRNTHEHDDHLRKKIKQTVMALPATLIPAEGQKTYSNDKHNLIYITT